MILLEQTDAGGSASSANQGFNSVPSGAEQFIMKVPNNKVNNEYVDYSSPFIKLRLTILVYTDVCRLLCSLAREERL